MIPTPWHTAPAEKQSSTTQPPQPTRARSLIAPLADLTQGRTNIRLVMVDVSAEDPQNVAVTDIRPLSRQVVSGVPARFSVRVANFTDADLRDLELSISLADQA